MADEADLTAVTEQYPESNIPQRSNEHQCGTWCGKIEEEQIGRLKNQVTVLRDGAVIRTSSPFAVPFAFGWERFEYHYNSPCGIRFYDLKSILKYLLKIKSKLSIKQFTFSNDFTYMSIPLSPEDKVICEDISFGKEPISIRCINNHDEQVIPPDFEYVTKNIYQPVINDEPRKFRSSCSCEDDCKNVLHCECRHLTDESEDLGQVPGNFDSKFFAGYRGVEKDLPRPYVFGLVECNSGCSCSVKCHNRLIQNGMINHLEVFRTEDRGWGVRCRHDLQPGEFVATYSGEVISYPEGERRGTDNDEYFTKINLIEMVEEKEGFEETAREMSDEEDGASKKVLGTSSDASESSDSLLSDISGSSSSSSGVEFVLMRNSKKRIIIQSGKSKDEPKMKEQHLKNSKTDWKDIDRFVPVRKYIAQNTSDGNKTADASKEMSNGQNDSDDDQLDLFRHILDAKRKGNVGRFLNHSCKPNCYLQIVFTDTHDPRMYQLAFFTTQKIKALTELTWDYMYQKEDRDKFVCLCDVCKEKNIKNNVVP